MRQSGLGRQRLGEQRRLVESSFEHAHPVQRHRRDQHIGLDQRGRGTGQPSPRRSNDVMPITMFQGQDDLSPVIAIEKRSATPTPGTGNRQAIIAKFRPSGILSRKRNTAGVATKTGNERCVAPTGSAKPKITVHMAATDRATRWINQL